MAKRVDAVVVHDISRPDIRFDSEANEVTILTLAAPALEREETSPRDGPLIAERHVPRAPPAQGGIVHDFPAAQCERQRRGGDLRSCRQCVSLTHKGGLR
mgnify:CR=1 FL=1